jgi:hypothetical protein
VPGSEDGSFPPFAFGFAQSSNCICHPQGEKPIFIMNMLFAMPNLPGRGRNSARIDFGALASC